MNDQPGQSPQLAIVDSLSVDVITDNVSDTYVSKTLFSVCRSSPTSCWRAPRRFRARRCLWPISATALRLRTRIGGTEHVLLFDTGTEGRGVRPQLPQPRPRSRARSKRFAVTHGHLGPYGRECRRRSTPSSRGRGRNAVSVHVNPGMFQRGAACC